MPSPNLPCLSVETRRYAISADTGVTTHDLFGPIPSAGMISRADSNGPAGFPTKL
jgi:hypothetical protein